MLILFMGRVPHIRTLEPIRKAQHNDTHFHTHPDFDEEQQSYILRAEFPPVLVS